MGTCMDYADGRLMLVIKDDEWNDDQLLRMKGEPFAVCFARYENISFFLAEGGALDTSDFYFDINACEAKDELLGTRTLQIGVYLLNEDNVIAWKKEKTLSEKESAPIIRELRKLEAMHLSEEEVGKTVEALQKAYDPWELGQYAFETVKIQ